MSQIKFDAEIRRLAVAFGSPQSCCQKLKSFADEAHLETRRVYLRNGIYYQVTITESDSEVDIYLDSSFSVVQVDIATEASNFLILNQWPDKPRILYNGDRSVLLTLVRAFYCLGLDLSFFETNFDFNITAHERLEWHAEFQRRLRENAAQKDD